MPSTAVPSCPPWRDVDDDVMHDRAIARPGLGGLHPFVLVEIRSHHEILVRKPAFRVLAGTVIESFGIVKTTSGCADRPALGELLGGGQVLVVALAGSPASIQAEQRCRVLPSSELAIVAELADVSGRRATAACGSRRPLRRSSPPRRRRRHSVKSGIGPICPGRWHSWQ